MSRSWTLSPDGGENVTVHSDERLQPNDSGRETTSAVLKSDPIDRKYSRGDELKVDDLDRRKPYASNPEECDKPLVSCRANTSECNCK